MTGWVFTFQASSNSFIRFLAFPLSDASIHWLCWSPHPVHFILYSIFGVRDLPISMNRLIRIFFSSKIFLVSPSLSLIDPGSDSSRCTDRALLELAPNVWRRWLDVFSTYWGCPVCMPTFLFFSRFEPLTLGVERHFMFRTQSFLAQLLESVAILREASPAVGGTRHNSVHETDEHYLG